MQILHSGMKVAPNGPHSGRSAAPIKSLFALIVV
jgi:hypothetical protein